MRNPTHTPKKTEKSNNPHFSHLNRAPYELGYLLKKLPADFSPFSLASAETLLIAEAAAQHASNANDTLLHGLESLGKIIFVACTNDEYEIDRSELSNLGCLIRHMATEMQFLQEIADNLHWAVRKNTSGQEGEN